jgi:hypothetical protein
MDTLTYPIRERASMCLAEMFDATVGVGELEVRRGNAWRLCN